MVDSRGDWARRCTVPWREWSSMDERRRFVWDFQTGYAAAAVFCALRRREPPSELFVGTIRWNHSSEPAVATYLALSPARNSPGVSTLMPCRRAETKWRRLSV